MYEHQSTKCASNHHSSNSEPEIISIPTNNFFRKGFGDHGSVQQLTASTSEITAMKDRDFREKREWLRSKFSLLHNTNSGQPSVWINVRSGSLLEDAVETVLSLQQNDCLRAWNIELEGSDDSQSVDRGLAQEWFVLVMKEIVDGGKGLWRRNDEKDSGLLINPWSGMLHEEHLHYFRLMGRMMGKALIEGHTIPNLLAPYIYKLLVGSSLTLFDLKQCSRRYYDVIKNLESIQDLSILGLNFTLTMKDPFENDQLVEIIPGGSSMRLTNKNFSEFKESLVKQLLIKQVQPQLMELIDGFHEVVPKQLLSILQCHELEVILCGSLSISHLLVPEEV